MCWHLQLNIADDLRATKAFDGFSQRGVSPERSACISCIHVIHWRRTDISLHSTRFQCGLNIQRRSWVRPGRVCDSRSMCVCVCACGGGVTLGFLLTAAGSEQIYFVADAVEGHSLKLVLYHLGHLFMGRYYTIGRLSKPTLGNKMLLAVCVSLGGSCPH